MSKAIEKINQKFASLTPFIIKNRWYIIATLLLITLALGFGMTKLQLENDVESWLLEGDPLREADEKFKEIYGNDDYVIVMLERDDVFSSESLAIIRSIGDQLLDKVPYSSEVTSLAHLDFITSSVEGIEVDELVADPIPTEPEELAEIKRLAFSKTTLVNRLFSEDCTKASVMLKLKPYPEVDAETGKEMILLDNQMAVDAAVKEIFAQEEFADLKYWLAGMPVMMVGELEVAMHDSETVLGLTMLIMIILLAIVFRSVVAVVGPLLVTILSTVWIFGVMGWWGIKIQEMIMIVPMLLIIVISIGYSVHILSFFRQEFLRSGNRVEAIHYALQHSAWPILFTALTTAIGFASFLLVPIAPIRYVGYLSASLVAVCYPILLFLLPALLSFGKDKEPNPDYQGTGGRIENFLTGLADWVMGHKKSIFITFLVVTIFFAAWIPALDVNTDYEKVIGLKPKYLADAVFVANSIGSMYSYEVTLEYPEEGGAKRPEVIKNLDLLAAELQANPINKRSTSIADIVKDLNQTLNEGDPEFYRVPDDPFLLAQLLLMYEMSGGSEAENWMDYEYRFTRLQVEMKDLNTVDVMKQIEYLQGRAEELFPGAKLGVTGMAVTFANMSNYLVDGQIISILVALAAISLVMMLVFGSFKLGLIGMIPNITPVIVALGAMSIFGTPLHMFTIMIAPMIIGIAVDDTIHFMNHYKLAFYRTGSYKKANKETFQTVGKAILMTSLIISLGFAAFFLSIILGFQHIGLYTIIAVITALAADYLVAPVVISWLKPFGPERDDPESNDVEN
jgi:predicted RND superfamily exporter protein